jgi:hypothetical protein
MSRQPHPTSTRSASTILALCLLCAAWTLSACEAADEPAPTNASLASSLDKSPSAAPEGGDSATPADSTSDSSTGEETICYASPLDPFACDALLLPVKDNPDLPADEAEAVFRAFDACFNALPTETICEATPDAGASVTPDDSPSDSSTGEETICYASPLDPTACDALLLPVKDNPDLPADEAQEVFRAFDACINALPTEIICEVVTGAGSDTSNNFNNPDGKPEDGTESSPSQ